jgi:hypothetical protein
MGWAGIGDYLDVAAAGVEDGAAMRGECASCPVLQGLADMVGQAYDNPAAAPGILAAARKRAAVLTLRAAVALEVLNDADRTLVPKPVPAAHAPIKPAKRGV